MTANKYEWFLGLSVDRSEGLLRNMPVHSSFKCGVPKSPNSSLGIREWSVEFRDWGRRSHLEQVTSCGTWFGVWGLRFRV